MYYRDDESKKNEEKYLRERIDKMTADSKVTVDMSSQKEYIINKNRYIMDLRNNIAKIDNALQEGIYKKLLIEDDIDEISNLLNKIDNKLRKLEYSLENEFEGVILSNQWDER